MYKQRIKELARAEADHLFTLKSKSRPWHFVFTAASTICITILIGVLFGQLSTGVLASMGAMVILNQPSTGNLRQRQGLLLLMAICMVCSYSLGLVAHNLPAIRTPIFVLVAFSMVFLGRYLSLKPPAGMFIMMTSSIAIFSAADWSDIPFKIMIVASGAAFAWFAGLLYNLLVIKPSAKPEPPRGNYTKGLLTETFIVTFFVVLSLEVALWIGMSYPYWVPVSCYIILQGIQLRTIWIKQLHRILGTSIGVIVAWFVLSFSFTDLGLVLVLFFMYVWIEGIIVRHYALAVIMITPMTILIAEYGRGQSSIGQAGQIAYQGVIQARFLDTVLGCSIALLGGLVMHSTWLRRPLMMIENKIFNKIR